jgi:hypothetical protein
MCIHSTTYQPIASLISLVRHQVREDRACLVILSGLNVASQLVQLLDRVRLDKVLIVQVVKQNVESSLSVHNVLPVLGRCLGLDTLHVCI